MLRITLHIERLLLIHDCVIIPKVGGFVLQSQAASFTKNPDTFMPAKKDLVFNQTLKHNDGLLTESYMRVYTVNYNQATAMQEKDTEELKNRLSLGELIHVGTMGALQVEQGILSFKRNTNNLFSVESYGLTAVTLPSLITLQQALFVDEFKATTQSKDVIYLPINKKTLRTSAVAAAAIALFLFIPSATNNPTQNIYQASFAPSQLVSQAFTEIPRVEIPEKLDIVVSTAIDQTIKVAEPKAIEVKKMYHLVIGSFPSEKEANQFYQKTDRSCYPNLGMITRQGKTRVYTTRYEDKQEAEKALNELRKTKGHQDAWLFASR